MQPINDFEFQNWSQTLSCHPGNYFQPESEQEVVEIVNRVREKGGVLRVFGSGHSWSPLVPTTDTLVNLDKLRQIVHIDNNLEQVTVEAGIRIKDLVVELDNAGLAMSNLGAIMDQSIAGAISTGTHGTGLSFGSLSTQIVGMKLVTADGQVRTLSLQTDRDLMLAARLSLGALGIITEVTIQCVPAYNLELKAWSAPFDEVLAQLDALNKNNDRVRLYWYANTDTIYVNTMDRTNQPVTKQSPLNSWLRNVVERHYVLGALLDVGHALPDLVDYINGFSARTGFQNFDEIDRSVKALVVLDPPLHIECEYAVPLENAVEAIRVNREIIRQNGYHVNVPSEIRFVKRDQIMLSPAYEQDVCYIGAYTTGEDFAEPYYVEYEAEMKKLGGRAHWGKQFNLTAKEIAGMYPRYADFVAIRKQLDPTNLFANPLIRDLFS